MEPDKLKIWVDADACPVVIKNILIRAADRRKIAVIFVANKAISIPNSDFISSLLVPGGFNVADEKIIERILPGELVVTADIPLAAEAIARDAFAIDYRGTLYTEENISERLSIRNFMAELRESGIETGGPATFSQKDRQTFANQLDKFLTTRLGAG